MVIGYETTLSTSSSSVLGPHFPVGVEIAVESVVPYTELARQYISSEYRVSMSWDVFRGNGRMGFSL